MRRRHNRHKPNNSIFNFDKTLYIEKELIDTVTLWMLRILLRAGGFKEFIDKNNYFDNDSVAYFLDLGSYVEKDTDSFTRQEVFNSLNEKLQKLEQQKKPSILPSFQTNLQNLSNLVGLDDTDLEILKFAVMGKSYKLFDTVIDYLGDDLTSKQAKDALALILDIDYHKINNALLPNATLVSSSLVTFQSNNWLRSDLSGKFELPSDTFIEFLFYSQESDITLALKDSIHKVSYGALSMKDYDYIKKDVTLLKQYLKKALKDKLKGVNVLLYGIPGTGKTELTKTIAKELKSELYEVSYIDEDDDAANLRERTKAYKNAQALLKNKNVILMYDEAEDIFDNYQSFFSYKKQDNKAWINHMLETNPIPTLWITNDIDSVDPAIVRRFDMTLEMKVPNKKKRIEIILHYANGMIDKKIIKKLAKNPYVSPAVIERAIKVAKYDKPEMFSKTVYRLIDKTLKAQRYTGLKKLKSPKKKPKDRLPNTYDPTIINVDTNLKRLAQGISKDENARLCFYGIPGTGKSAYGQYIAKKLGRKVIVKKGSDLLSMWVGGTEKNIAKAFDEAKKKKAVLIFDEVDSFLRDRTQTNANWEVTQVNEMLTQMESFEGVFIATTNLLDNLDKASLRRFDMKLEFKALQPQQAQKLLLSYAKVLDFDTKKTDIIKSFDVTNLTPGDFATVMRQHKFNPIDTLEEFVKRLKEEIKVKTDKNHTKKMGFLV